MPFSLPHFRSSAAADRSASTASAGSDASSAQKPKKMSAIEQYWILGPQLHGFGSNPIVAPSTKSTKVKKEKKEKKMSAIEEYWILGPQLHGFAPVKQSA